MNPILLVASIGDKIDSAFAAFDLWVFHFFGSIQCGFLTIVAKLFTALGDEAFVIPMVIVGAVLCLFKKTRKYGATLVIAIIIGTLITNIAVKPMVMRIRPYNTLQGNAEYFAWYVGAGRLSESDFSFPSGHTTGAFEMATAMFLCFRKDKKKIAWLFPALAVGVMGSRVYLMVHYATDVIGGMLVGIFAGVMAYLIATLACKIKFIEKIDAEKLFKNGIKPRVASLLIVAVVLGVFAYSFVPSLTEGGDEAVRCAYVGEYDCQNEARVDDEDYPPIDGKNYCKIHWKQLTQQQIVGQSEGDSVIVVE